ncbi:hypothetical protein EI94DRAFT_1830440 [Lactarius quietus]|nr:hypothetical protein EI94DRAFT_1830440 [Lactarius quietus]
MASRIRQFQVCNSPAEIAVVLRRQVQQLEQPTSQIDNMVETDCQCPLCVLFGACRWTRYSLPQLNVIFASGFIVPSFIHVIPPKVLAALDVHIGCWMADKCLNGDFS